PCAETPMELSQSHYLPLTPAFFSILVGLVAILFIFIQLRILRYAYMRLGISSAAALLLLVGSLTGAYFNIPVAELPGERVLSGQVVDFFGMQYVVPVVARWPGTVIAVNVGGALIPTVMSIYLLLRYRVFVQAAIATAVVAAVCYWLSDPVPGVGIAIPVFVPPLAYIAGSLGTLIGADLLNLGRVRGLGAPIASIGGAGTFDGIFLTGVLAVLLASLTRRPVTAP